MTPPARIATQRQKFSVTRLLDERHPALWLAYLPFFFIPWFIRAPHHAQIAGAMAGLAVFLPIYLFGDRQHGRGLIIASLLVLVLSFALAFTGGNWTVIAIYAAAMIGNIRPSAVAWRWIAGMAILAAAWGFVVAMPLFYLGLGVFFMVMVGMSSISRAALRDKNAALERAQSEVRQLAATAERERIGRDLHDLLGRTLTLISVKADLAGRLAALDTARAEAEMRVVADAARGALLEVRAAVAGMTGATLSREIAAARLALQAAGIECRVEGEATTIEQGAGAVMAMTLREAITNVIRHSGAKTCSITISSENGALRLSVADDGNGALLREGGGLGGVRARLAAAGGELDIAGAGTGTLLRASLPAGAAP